MGTKIYVGNLSYTTTEDELQRVFGEHGPVASVKIIKDQMTGRSKGFAFVEMENEEDAQKAISGLNQTDLSGRTIKVDEARETSGHGKKPRNFRY